MTDGILKKTTKKAAEEAKKAAKQALGEIVEIPKEAVRQATGVGTSPLVETIQPSGMSATVKPEEIRAQAAKDKTKLDYLEKELEELAAKEKLVKQQSQAAQQVSPSKPALGPLVEPTTRPKRGMLIGLPGKQGTKEVIKTPSG